MLVVENLNVFHGESPILHDIGFELASGETLAIMGRNGMGKTTLLKSLIGLIQIRSGSVALEGVDLTHTRSHQRVAAGLGYVPQGRMIFVNLSVEENILTGMDKSPKRTIPEFVFDAFPILWEMRKRRGGDLSGGQQQQLAIARALVSEPKVLVLDEPTDGIQPSIVKEIARTLNRLKQERQFSILMSEQALAFTLEIADRFLILEKGRFVHEDTRADVDAAKIKDYLTI